MDELLHRMLAIDEEAEEIVRQAQREAAALTAAGRTAAQQAQHAAQQALNHECAQLRQREMARVEAENLERLDQLALELRGRVVAFTEAARHLRADIYHALTLGTTHS